ncbi:hypothetical protein SBF1_1590001 [Candidatus Desulfosporosinus infrequens]|uniref:Uncharacterized protein n=1 Tax=Candidatus Desulfosporosinus infrequens TaxID=2043169 RepID=A0A2U3K996_9FIRM|nr:hypothetical protein SBF1_1590001 [Candidatus Desulfosporosinus infrequens]
MLSANKKESKAKIRVQDLPNFHQLPNEITVRTCYYVVKGILFPDV